MDKKIIAILLSKFCLSGFMLLFIAQSRFVLFQWVRDIRIDKRNNQMFAMHGNGIIVVNFKVSLTALSFLFIY